jgi:hypothetical protein
MAAPARPEDELLAEALDNIDDDAAFLPLALSALKPSGRSAVPSARAPALALASELFWPHTAAARALSLMSLGHRTTGDRRASMCDTRAKAQSWLAR